MPKLPSNRALLVNALMQVVLDFQDKPSVLLADLEDFLAANSAEPKRQSWKSVPTWIKMGFLSEEEMEEFKNRPDFPGWDAL